METKKCPICGGEVNAEATRCKHCKEQINPEIEPQQEPSVQKVEDDTPKQEVKATDSEAQPIADQPTKKNLLAVYLSIGLLTLTGINFFYICIMLSEHTSQADGAMPEWLMMTLQLIMLFGILITMHRHFVAARSKLAQFIFALLLTPFLIAIVVISADTISGSTMARLLALPAVFGILAGLAVANSEREQAAPLGFSLFALAVVDCATAIFVGESEIYWWSEILSFLSQLIFSLVACNYFLHAPKYDVEDAVEQKQNPWFVGIAVALLAIFSLLMSVSSLDEEEYMQDEYGYESYHSNSSQYKLRQDDMFYYRYKSIEFYFALGVDKYDNTHIIKSARFDALDAESLATPKELGCEEIFEIFQSDEYSHVVYYNGMTEYSEFVYGILDLRFEDYTLYNSSYGAEVLGLITKGKYAGSYVCLYDYDDVKIYRQDPPGINPVLIASGQISDCMTEYQYDKFSSGEMTNYEEVVISYLQSL